MMRTANPTLKPFSEPMRWADLDQAEARVTSMTMQGTAVKTGILLAVCAASAVISFGWASTGSAMATPALWGGLAVGLILALAISFKPRMAPFLAPLYAVAEGGLLGVISFYAAQFVGSKTGGGTDMNVIFQAVTLTFGIMAAMLIGYASGVLRLGSVAKKMVIGATAGIALTYLLSMMLPMFGVRIPGIFGSGPIGIGFSLFVIVLASLNLSLDFELIQKGVQSQAPKFMEWYGGFALLTTLVWLYIEILRLLMKLANRD